MGNGAVAVDQFMIDLRVGNAQEIEKRLFRHSGRNYFLDISVRANMVEEWEQ